MKNSLALLTILILTSCLTSKEHRQWNSEKYPDNHFYVVLRQPTAMDTTIIRLNKIYSNQTDGGNYSHLLFTADQKVYLYKGPTNKISTERVKNDQQLLGYFKTEHDTLTIEQIVIIRFIFTKNGKGLFPTYKHLKTNGIIQTDSLLLLSNQPTDFKTANQFRKCRPFRLN